VVDPTILSPADYRYQKFKERLAWLTP
jgi:hypothetical protein